MPKAADIKKIMVIGSGPIVIGQAAEFDYAGTQACQALKEEGVEVVLVNSNPATIMTDTSMADKVYMEPLTAEFVTRVIQRERPDGLLATLGGQTGLNIAVKLAENGVLEEQNVRLLGTKLESIKKAEDRELFRTLMQEIGEPVPESEIIHTVEEAVAFAEQIGYPLIVRPAYTLGGTGGGIAADEESLREIVANGLKYSPISQCLVEKSLFGYKEIEYEVMRDRADNCIVVCNMENIDPVGVHTGDSVVVAPSQTLADTEYQMLRSASLKIIRALQIEGGCNVQFALDPYSETYYVIEVNPRVSRSSALASKATGYPIAKMAAKIAVGYTLDELRNPVTGQTYACFEPALDYVVTKIPRWPFDKFTGANRKLGTQMKATGEVMAIGRTLEESLLKAVRSLEVGAFHLELADVEKLDRQSMEQRLVTADDERLFIVAEALRQGMELEQIHQLTLIDRFFLYKINNIVKMERELAARKEGKEGATGDGVEASRSLITKAKRMGFTDRKIARLLELPEGEIRQLRENWGLMPVYKMVDTCAAEFPASTPYYYSTYEEEDEREESSRQKVVVLGSGPIRIGQGIEFDYATVHAVWAIREAGYEAIIINNNPETVSTDFNTSDRLYFEPLYLEDVLHVIEKEKPLGVIVQFGGQTAINLAEGLVEAGVTILGTDLAHIDEAENREKFEQLLESLKLNRPPGRTVTSVEEAISAAEILGYPVLVRPSYVLGGRAMEIVYNQDELLHYMNEAVKINPQHPVLIDRYLLGKEVEVDAIADGKRVLIPGIMEHIERAGVHSGDSIAVYPPQSLSSEQKQRLMEMTEQIALALEIKGLVNIQYVIHEGQVYVLEVNPRSSRTVPFLSKVTGVPMANVATKTILGIDLQTLGYEGGLYPEDDRVSVKVPVFSFAKLRRVDTTLGPEMKSTGEVMGRERNLSKALYKGLLASGMKIPVQGTILVTVANKDKEEATEIIRRFYDLGFRLMATEGTAAFLQAKGMRVDRVKKLSEGSPNLLDVIREGEAQIVINTLTKGKTPQRDGFRIRREAVENEVVCLTSLDTAHALLQVLELITFSTEAMPATDKKELVRHESGTPL